MTLSFTLCSPHIDLPYQYPGVPVGRNPENDCVLMLWNARKLETNIKRFVGHRDIVMDFCWREQEPKT